MAGTPITVQVGGHDLRADLHDSPTAADLLDLLPLALPLEDFQRQEKLGRLPRRLSTESAPSSSGAAAADLGYYAPSQHLVLYYADVAPFPGIIPLGRFAAADARVIRDLTDGVIATISRG